MPKTNGDKHAIAKRRAEVSDYYLRGWTQHRIAAEVGTSRSTVAKDLIAIRREWLESRIRDFDEARSIELAKLDRVESEAWAAWERSQRDAVSTKTMLEGGEGGNSKAERTVKGQCGDSRFLDIVAKCVERRCKLLGLDAPEKHAQTDSQGRDVRLTEEERQRHIDAILAERLTGKAGGHHSNGNGNGNGKHGGDA